MCFVGQSHVFEEGEKLFMEFLGLETSGKQIQRVSEYYGKKIESLETSNTPTTPPLLGQKNETVYGMLDGSMLFTREEKWKEVKLGRLFCASNRAEIQPKRTELTKSQYVCHLGGHIDFLEKMDRYLDPYKNKILIGDGAKWIWNWADINHSEVVQLLDYFHAVEKIIQFAIAQWSSTNNEYTSFNRWGEVVDIVKNAA